MKRMSFFNQKEQTTPYLLGADLKNRNQIKSNKPKTKTTHILVEGRRPGEGSL
jgi:hypothetical protein